MKKTATMLMTGAFLFLILAAGCRQVTPVPVAFFYLESCPGCESYQRAEALGDMVSELDRKRQYDGQSWNMAVSPDEANDELLRMIEERELPDISYALPLLFSGEEYFVGYEDITEELNKLTGELQ